MANKPPKAFDVWFVAANTVYKGVPYHVVADWAQEGRLRPTDMVRPAGTNMAWATVAEHELPRRLPAAADGREGRCRPAAPADGAVGRRRCAARTAGAELPDPESLTLRHNARRGRRRSGHDPAHRHQHGAARLLHHAPGGRRLPSIDVPEMRYGGELTQRPDGDHHHHREAGRGDGLLLGSRRSGRPEAEPRPSRDASQGHRSARRSCWRGSSGRRRFASPAARICRTSASSNCRRIWRRCRRRAHQQLRRHGGRGTEK